ncbi:hypothetical protein BGX34_001107 [Mortierella sp. NVP85]|nr:hypothetical protein BGX34_001107 [Mortierella sp. NVP85]
MSAPSSSPAGPVPAGDVHSSTARSGRDANPTSGTVAALRITEIGDDHQALILHTQGPSSDTQISHHPLAQRLIMYSQESVEPTQAQSNVQPVDGASDETHKGMACGTNHNEQLSLLQQQIEKALQESRLTREQMNQWQEQMNEHLQTMQQTSQQRMDDLLHKMQQLNQQREQATSFDGELEVSRSSRFRLYYLCECGDHTTAKGSQETHEVHIAEHPGYDLEDQDGFFEKYGPYLLVMMYMVKYGAAASGRIVPPLSDLKLSKGTLTNHELDHLVNGTITYLESALCVSNTGHIPHSRVDLAQLRSYLRINEDGNAFGDLSQTTSQQRHRVWVCSKHLHECRKSTIHQLKEIIASTDGECFEEQGRITIKITSDTLTKQFFDALLMVRQNSDSDSDQWSTASFDLELFSRHSNTATTRVVIDIGLFESLSFDFGRLLLRAAVGRDGARGMEVEVEKLCDLTSDDMDFIRQCHLKRLTIKRTPSEADDERLVKILRHNDSLQVLRIGCLSKRSLAIINKVISTREGMLHNKSPISLRTLEARDEELVPIDKTRLYSDRDHIESTLTFSEDLELFDMQTSIVLRKTDTIPRDDPVCDFFRQYGWTIDTLDAPATFNDHLAELLCDAVRSRGSRIKRLSVNPASLTKPGLDALDQAIRTSASSSYLRLIFSSLGMTDRLEKALLLLGRCKERISSLHLSGFPIEAWLPRFMQAFPTRSCFPRLSIFVVGCNWSSEFSQDYTEWIVAMVSAPPPALQPEPKPMTRLSGIGLSYVELQPESWRSVIEAIDFTELRWVDLEGANATPRELGLLVDRIVSMDTLALRLNSLKFDRDVLENDEARLWCAKLYEKMPQVKIDDGGQHDTSRAV